MELEKDIRKVEKAGRNEYTLNRGQPLGALRNPIHVMSPDVIEIHPSYGKSIKVKWENGVLWGYKAGKWQAVVTSKWWSEKDG